MVSPHSAPAEYVGRGAPGLTSRGRGPRRYASYPRPPRSTAGAPGGGPWRPTAAAPPAGAARAEYRPGSLAALASARAADGRNSPQRGPPPCHPFPLPRGFFWSAPRRFLFRHLTGSSGSAHLPCGRVPCFFLRAPTITPLTCYYSPCYSLIYLCGPGCRNTSARAAPGAGNTVSFRSPGCRNTSARRSSGAGIRRLPENTLKRLGARSLAANPPVA